MTNLDRLQTAVYALIQRYVGRQAIVLEAMRELRPDMFIGPEDKGSREQWRAKKRKWASQPSTGFWGEDNEWAYRLHGNGCHLTHTKTGEVIGWDLVGLETFDWHWFADNLKWLLNSSVGNDDVEAVRTSLQSSEINRRMLWEFILPILQDLEDAGVIVKKNEPRYTLISTE